jgi:hypothetical protein
MDTCIAKCLVVPSYTAYESFRQFSCFTADITPSKLPTVHSILPYTPTYLPTLVVIKTYLVVQSVSGMTVQQATSEEFKEVFKMITASAFGAGVDTANIDIKEITAISGGRMLLQPDLLGILVAYVITVTNSDNATLSANINSAIGSGNFTTALEQNGYPAAIARAPVILIDITDAADRTSIPTASPRILSVGGIVGTCM